MEVSSKKKRAKSRPNDLLSLKQLLSIKSKSAQSRRFLLSGSAVLPRAVFSQPGSLLSEKGVCNWI